MEIYCECKELVKLLEESTLAENKNLCEDLSILIYNHYKLKNLFNIKFVVKIIYKTNINSLNFICLLNNKLGIFGGNVCEYFDRENIDIIPVHINESADLYYLPNGMNFYLDNQIYIGLTNILSKYNIKFIE